MKGLKLPQHKKETINNVIKKIDTKYLYFNVPDDYEILVKKGDSVKINTLLAVATNNTSIISSVSGKILEIGKTIKIENDFKEKKEQIDIKKIDKDKFIELLKNGGIRGMGGAGYPTYKKYENEINTLIVNAVECEPYRTSDYALVKEYSKEIIDSIKKIMQINNISKTIIAVKKISKMADYFKPFLTPNITIYETKNIYPAGWSKGLVKEILNINVNTHASDLGIIVNNVATIYAIGEVLKGNYLESIIVTRAGNTDKKGNYRLKIGTDIKDIINTDNLIIGGPMMGKEYTNNFITPEISCLFVNDDKFIETTCIRCGKCTKVCPAHLEPVLIKDNIDNKEKLKKLNPNKCIGCGLCSYICPARINLREIVRKAR